jgi:hypothetical protein
MADDSGAETGPCDKRVAVRHSWERRRREEAMAATLGGALTINESRALLDLPPLQEGALDGCPRN